MALADGVLQLPSLHALLGKRNELFSSAHAEYAKVLMLCAVLELDGALPSADVCSTRREAEVDDVRKGKFLQELGTLCLVDTDHGGQGIGIETAIGAVAHRFGRCIWCDKSGDGVVARCPVDEPKGLLCTICRRRRLVYLKYLGIWQITHGLPQGEVWRPFCPPQTHRKR